MPAFAPVGSNDPDRPGPAATPPTPPLAVSSRLTSTWPNDDFLTWSSRQKDADFVIEYDV